MILVDTPKPAAPWDCIHRYPSAENILLRAVYVRAAAHGTNLVSVRIVRLLGRRHNGRIMFIARLFTIQCTARRLFVRRLYTCGVGCRFYSVVALKARSAVVVLYYRMAGGVTQLALQEIGRTPLPNPTVLDSKLRH